MYRKVKKKRITTDTLTTFASVIELWSIILLSNLECIYKVYFSILLAEILIVGTIDSLHPAKVKAMYYFRGEIAWLGLLEDKIPLHYFSLMIC